MTDILDLPVTDGTGPLIACGRVGWPQVTRMLAGSQAAWADYDGFPFRHSAGVSTSVLAHVGLDRGLARADPARRPVRDRRSLVLGRSARQSAARAVARGSGVSRSTVTDLAPHREASRPAPVRVCRAVR
jgi:hypothetical protein